MDLFGGHIVHGKTTVSKVKVEKPIKPTVPVLKEKKVKEPKPVVEPVVKESTSILMTVATQYARKLAEGYNYIVYKAGDGFNTFSASFETYAFNETGAQAYCANKNMNGGGYFYKDIKEVILDLKKSDDSYKSWRKIK